jgi:hypothetical protein
MAQIKNKFIANDAVTGTKIRLSNNESLRARNAGDSADVEMMKLDSSDILQFLSHPRISSTASNTDDVLTLKDLNQELEGLKPKQACRVASTATLTLSAPQTIDGVSVIAGDRVLVKDQAAPAANGIYVVAAGAWTRATDMDSVTPVNEVNGAYTFIQEGTDNAGKGFVQQGTVTTLDTDAINFVFFNSLADLSGSNAIDITANVVSLTLDGSTLTQSGSGVKVADGQIDELQLSSNVDSESFVVATPFTPGAGTVTAGDTLHVAMQKMDANTSAKQDPISGSNAVDVTADVVSVTIDGSTLSQSASGIKIADGQVDELQLSSNVDAESLLIATGYTAGSGTVTVGDTLQAAIEKVEGKVDGITSPVESREVITLDGTDITNQYVDLASTPLANSVSFEISGAPTQVEGVDWSVSTNRITFLGELATAGAAALESGDVLQVTYRV